MPRAKGRMTDGFWAWRMGMRIMIGGNNAWA
jgi:hypothetical protein